MDVDFSKEHEYIPIWKDNKSLPEKDQIKATIRVMDVDDLMALLDNLSAAASGVAPEELVVADVKTNVAKAKDLLKSSGHLLPKYATVTNLRAKNGGDVTIQDVIRYPMFMGLATELVTVLARYSMPNEVEQKN